MKLISGTFQNLDGTPVAGGRLFLRLSQDAVAVGATQVSSANISFSLDSTGSVPANTKCWFNDELSPANTTYTVSVIAAGGGLVWGAESVYINGSSFNLDNAIPTNTGVSFGNVVLQNPTAVQTITGFDLDIVGANLNVTGNISATGSLAVGGNETIGGNLTVTGTITGSGIPTASGTANSIAKFTGTSSLGNSSITDDGTTVTISEKFSSKNENNFTVIHVDQYASWAAAFADCPTAGCTLDGRSQSTPTAIGTFDPGSSKAVTILLGPMTYTLDHMILRSGLVVKGMGIENVQGTKIQAVGTANQAPFILPTSGSLVSVQDVILSDFELEATSGNTAQDGFFFDVSVGNLPAGSNLEYSKFSRIFFNSFKGSAIHLKGPIISATSVVQFNDFEILQVNPPASSTTIGTCLRMEGAVGQNMFFNFTASQQGGSATETLVYLGVTNASDGVGPYSNQFYGTTIQNGAVGVLINGCQSCAFRDSHAELDSIVFQIKTPSGGTWHNDVILLDGGVANGNVGINAGAGAIVDASDATNTFSSTVILENWTLAPPATPDKLAKGVNGTNVILRNNKFDTSTPSVSTTGIVSGFSTSTTTLNFQNAKYAFVNGCTGGNVQTLTSALGTGEMLNLYFNVSCSLAGGGNMILGAGSPSPITFNAGEQATFINGDISGSNVWYLLNTTADKAIGFFSSPGRTSLLASTTVYGTPAVDTLYAVVWSVTCKTQVAAATATATITYTDTSGTAQSVAGSTATCTALGTNSHATNQIAIDGKASTNINVSVAIAGSPNYDVRVGVIKMGGS